MGQLTLTLAQLPTVIRQEIEGLLDNYINKIYSKTTEATIRSDIQRILLNRRCTYALPASIKLKSGKFIFETIEPGVFDCVLRFTVDSRDLDHYRFNLLPK